VGNNDWNVYCFSNYVTYEEPSPPENGTLWGYIAVAVIAVIVAAVAIAVGYVIRKRAKK
jgi:cytochrome c-type biogenesis protein CcmH/NrfF